MELMMLFKTLSKTGWAALGTAAALGLALGSGCGETEDAQGAAEVLPHQSPAPLGEMYPLGDNDPDPSGNVRTPFEWILLLQSQGESPLTIDDVCLVGDGVEHFEMEIETQELPATVDVGDTYGVRVTYDRQDPNDADEVDNVAVVAQSDASNFPTLVVPVCARVVADGEDRGSVECESPVDVAAGESNPDLCN
jgi:hypothetical protein